MLCITFGIPPVHPAYALLLICLDNAIEHVDTSPG